jgi:dUTP pyrophosphatase
MILPKWEIRKLIEEQDMISNYSDLDKQLQPNGFDLTLDNVYDIDGCGMMYTDDKFLPELNKLRPDVRGKISLYKLDGIGAYAFDVCETVKLPLDVCALTIQRSSIMRCGVITNVGFWDSGYNDKGYSILNIMNRFGFVIEKGTRIIQMIFMKNISEIEGYKGQYQNERIHHIGKEELSFLSNKYFIF